MNGETASDSDFHWYTPFAVGLLVGILLVVGPGVLLTAWCVRQFASQVPVWDPDRRWDAVRGCAVLGSAVYAFLAARLVVFAGPTLDLTLGRIGQRALLTVSDFSPRGLLAHSLAGLLLTGVFALLMERSSPRTDRSPWRMVTEAEQQTLQAREAERQRLQEVQTQREHAAAEAERKRQAAVREAATRRAPAQPARPDPPIRRAGTASEISAEEARNQFLADQAARSSQSAGQPAPPSTMPDPSPTPPPDGKPKKPDKGDGSMDELL